jgi:hypothetical protein
MDGDVYFDSVDLWDKQQEEQLKGQYGRHSMNAYACAVPVVHIEEVLEYNNMYKYLYVK